ncbi:hypothetical protein [Bradyrhizobium sp. SSUT77]|nr:hypothetical protein [Bradyrhizobium sp. SSUT77]MDH2347451.1 hypothetical protein [Bradyrhizobium sp. SSUT77]
MTSVSGSSLALAPHAQSAAVRIAVQGLTKTFSAGAAQFTAVDNVSFEVR